MIFGYDKENGWGKLFKDFFKAPEGITRKLNNAEKNFFDNLERDKNGNVARSKENILDDLLGYDQNEVNDLTSFIEKNPLKDLTADNFTKSLQTATNGMSQFEMALSTVGKVGKTVFKTIGNMALSAVASWAIGKTIEGIDNWIHKTDNLIKAGEEARESISTTFKSFEDGNTSIKDMASGLSDSTEQIKTTKCIGFYIR